MPTNKPGERANRSGLYNVVGPRGGLTNTQRTIVKDEPFPPTPKKNQHYVMAVPANNGSGRKTK